MDDLEIPDFLKIDADARRRAWSGKRLTKPKAGPDRREVPADVLAFKRELERRQKEKQAERFAMLRERAAELRRKAVKP